MSPEFINNIATLAGVLVAALGAFLFAFWVAMGIWTFNDIRSRSRDWLAIILAVLLVMVFPLVGLILYMLIRPKATLADVYDRALEEEALLRELEETHACHSCGVPVKDTWVFCPTCHGQLQHSCPNCGNLVRNEWAICVYCGAPQRPAVASRPAAQELGMERPVLGPSQPQALPAGMVQSAYAPQTGISQAGASQAGISQAQPGAASSAVRRPTRNPFARETSQPAAPVPPPSAPDVDDETYYRPARAGEG